ncbi:hypothetical protein BH09CHL1_BH09CHL1_36280 [soil metagenome]
MVIELTKKSQAIVSELLESGEFRSESEVVEHLLIKAQVLEHRERIRASVLEGFAQIERGEGIALTPEVWDEIDREADEIVRLGLPIDPDVYRQSLRR